MEGLSSATVARARERLAGMLGPVVLVVPKADEGAEVLARTLSANQPLLELEQGEEEPLALRDGYGHPTGIQFLGLPLGQELEALLDAILAVSRGTTPLTPLGRMQARELAGGLDLRVLVTPS